MYSLFLELSFLRLRIFPSHEPVVVPRININSFDELRLSKETVTAMQEVRELANISE